MNRLFEEYKISLNEEQLNLFEKYYRLLIEYNSYFNLTSITEREEVYKKHFVDSVIGVNKLIGEKLIDVGSGAGFPALAIKIVKPELQVTLIESIGKKCEFLKTVVKKLNLSNVNVINGRAEDYAKNENFREKFDIVTARAVAKLNTIAEYCLPFVKVGGFFVSYKGNAKEEIKEAENAFSILGGKVNEVNEYNLEEAVRTLIYVKKIKNTPEKYPRGHGKERKNPL